MADKLIVNGTELDLLESQPISVTFSQADIKNASKRKRSFSKSFSLAGTKNNIQFFRQFVMLTFQNNPNLTSDVTFDSSVNLPARLYKDEHLKFEGYVKLTEITINRGVINFIVNMHNEVSNFFQLWDDRLISDLDWSIYNHPLNEEHIKFSFNDKVKVNGVYVRNFSGVNPRGFGYLYGVIDYGLSPNQTDYKDNQLGIAVYYREVFMKAFESLGFTVDSLFMNSNYFKSLLLERGNGELVTLPTALVNSLAINVKYNATYNKTVSSRLRQDPITGFIEVDGASQYKIINLNSSELTFTQTTTTDALSQVNNGIVTVGATARYKINIGFTATAENLGVTDATLLATKYNAIVYLVKSNGKVNLGAYAFNGNAVNTWTFSAELEMQLTTNDEYYFQIELISSMSVDGIGTYGNLTTKLNLNNSFIVTSQCISSQVNTNDTVYLSSYLPTMKIVDFVKAVITQFNLYISDPTADNVVKIEPMPRYYEDNSINDDLSNKLDYNKEIKIIPLANQQPSTLSFEYATDMDFYRENYFNQTGRHFGNYEHKNTLNYAGGVEKYTLPYTLTPLVELDNGLFIPRIIKVDNGVVKPFKGSPRIYAYGGMKTGNYNIIDYGGTPIAETSYPILSTLNKLSSPTLDLCFSTPEIVYYTATSYTTNTAYKEYYSLSVNELNNIDSKMLVAYFRLTQKDIYNGFMRRLKFIDGVLYRFNLLTDYNLNKDDSYPMELVKVLDVRSNKSMSIPRVPQTKRVDTSNGNALIQVAGSVQASASDNIIIVDSSDVEKVVLDIATLPIGKVMTVINVQGLDVQIEPIPPITINGAANHIFNGAFSSVKFVNTGTEFLIIE